MTEDRNFRSYYYEKVGFRGVEEKKSLQILLKDDPLDNQKLSVFCQRFPVPSMYRHLVWKVLLRILPVHQSIHKCVWKQRTEQCDDLQRSLRIMDIINDDTPQCEVIFKMFLLEQGQLPLEDKNAYDVEDSAIYLSLAKCVGNMVDDIFDAYWLTLRLYQVQEKQTDLLITLPFALQGFISKEDHVLYEHLLMMGSFEKLPYHLWFPALFSSMFPVSVVEKIWDRFIGGSYKFLVFVAVAVFVTHKRRIMGIKKTDELIEFLAKLPYEHCDVMLAKASDLWERYGSTKSDVS